MLRNLPTTCGACGGYDDVAAVVAATKIDSPLMAVSGRHLRLEHGKVCDRRGGWVINTLNILQFLSPGTHKLATWR